MGWAKFEEDNREARTERYSNGNYFWTPYIGQNVCQGNSGKPATTYLYQTKPTTGKKKSYGYSY